MTTLDERVRMFLLAVTIVWVLWLILRPVKATELAPSAAPASCTDVVERAPSALAENARTVAGLAVAGLAGLGMLSGLLSAVACMFWPVLLVIALLKFIF